MQALVSAVGKLVRRDPSTRGSMESAAVRKYARARHHLGCLARRAHPSAVSIDACGNGPTTLRTRPRRNAAQGKDRTPPASAAPPTPGACRPPSARARAPDELAILSLWAAPQSSTASQQAKRKQRKQENRNFKPKPHRPTHHTPIIGGFPLLSCAST